MSKFDVTEIEYAGYNQPSITFGSSGQLGFNSASYGTSGQVLKSQGVNTYPIWGDAPGGTPSIQVFTSSGTFTPTSGKTIFIVYCIGAGGGSSGSITTSAGWGGGSGGCAWYNYNTTQMGSSASVTIGTGGAAGSYTGFLGNYYITAGSNGGDTTFNPGGTGVTLTGGGGEGGGANGLGGTATNGRYNWKGQAGDHPNSSYSTYYIGRGGASIFHGGGRGADANTGGSNGSGNAGSNGLVVVFEY